MKLPVILDPSAPINLNNLRNQPLDTETEATPLQEENLPSATSSTKGDSVESKVTAAAHVYDKGYKKWEAFDVDAACEEAVKTGSEEEAPAEGSKKVWKEKAPEEVEPGTKKNKKRESTGTLIETVTMEAAPNPSISPPVSPPVAVADSSEMEKPEATKKEAMEAIAEKAEEKLAQAETAEDEEKPEPVPPTIDELKVCSFKKRTLTLTPKFQLPTPNSQLLTLNS